MPYAPYNEAGVKERVRGIQTLTRKHESASMSVMTTVEMTTSGMCAKNYGGT